MRPGSPWLQRLVLVVLLLGSGGAALAWFASASTPAAAKSTELVPALPELAPALHVELARVVTRARRIVLVGQSAPLPSSSGPIHALSARGVLMTRSAGSAPTRPGPELTETLAIVLPADSLADTGPEAKAALLVLLARLGANQSSRPETVGLLDEPGELGRLLRWLP